MVGCPWKHRWEQSLSWQTFSWRKSTICDTKVAAFYMNIADNFDYFSREVTRNKIADVSMSNGSGYIFVHIHSFSLNTWLSASLMLQHNILKLWGYLHFRVLVHGTFIHMLDHRGVNRGWWLEVYIHSSLIRVVCIAQILSEYKLRSLFLKPIKITS